MSMFKYAVAMHGASLAQHCASGLDGLKNGLARRCTVTSTVQEIVVPEESGIRS